MSDCNYSIVPKPAARPKCSRCGTDIEDLPFYTQVAKLYVCIAKDKRQCLYVGVGLGAPMCENCDSAVEEIIRKNEKKHRYIFIAFAILALVLVSVAKGSNPGVMLFLVVAVIGVFIVLNMNSKERHSEVNRKIANEGLDVVRRPFDYLKKKGWGQLIDGEQEPREYTEGHLRLDLEEICRTGEYCILDNSTGTFVDYRNPEILTKIHSGSIWKFSSE